MMNKHPFPGEWNWWASFNGSETMAIGPCITREQAIDEANQDRCGEYEDENGKWYNAFTVMECQENNIDLASWFDCDRRLEDVGDLMDDNECGANSNGDGHPLLEINLQDTKDLQACIRSAIRHWQTRKGLKLRSYWFANTRKSTYINLQVDEE